jgi:predicted esterase YcpF (UPF0227 family)
MPKVLYLHGFASCGEGNKSTVLTHFFGKESVFVPNLPFAPLDAIAFLEALLVSSSYELLIGSSLGGFYATYLAEKYGLKAVLLNPSTQPWLTLAPYVGWQKRFCDEQIFEFKAVYLEQLKMLQTPPQNGSYLLLLQSEDEVLDYTKAQIFYNAQRVIVEYGGNHRFENLDDYLLMIENFKNK